MHSLSLSLYKYLLCIGDGGNLAPDIFDQLKDWHLIYLETENTFAFCAQV